MEGAPFQSTRSEAMGGVRVQFNGEASSGFLNPAAMGSMGSPVFYLDYTGEDESEIKGAADIRPLRKLNISFLAGSRERQIGIFGLGFAARLLTGTPNTYLNAGASAKMLTGINDEREYSCCAEGLNDGGETGSISAGIIFRPFPSFSIRYVGEWVADSVYRDVTGTGDNHRAGITFHILSAVFISLEREFLDEGSVSHYGFNLQTVLPIEIMTGINDGRVSGGLRLSWRFLNSSVVFSENEDGGLHTRFSLEYSGEDSMGES
ncbi:MAG: hypothetical protein R6U43_00125 [Candidatus Krumholzibacteriales bacterium]